MGSAEARAHELSWEVDPATGGRKDAEHGGRGGCGREYGPRELSRQRRRVGETRGTPPECADGSEAFTVGDAGKAGEDEHKEIEKHLVVQGQGAPGHSRRWWHHWGMGRSRVRWCVCAGDFFFARARDWSPGSGVVMSI